MNRGKDIVWTGLSLVGLLFVCPATGAIAGEEVVPINVVYALGDIVAAPGESTTVPLTVRADAPVLGYAFSADFDEEVLQVEDVELVWQRPDGQDFDFIAFGFDNSNETPGNGGVDEGVIAGAFVFSFEERMPMPADTDVEVARIHFRVSPEAPDGGATEVRFLDGAKPAHCPFNCAFGTPVINSVAVVVDDEEHLNLTPGFVASFLLVDCQCIFRVVPDLAIFKRGDSNRDGVVNVGDPTATLNSLFLGSGELTCPDAADADDDGTVLLGDAIYTLNFLFLGGADLPAPGPYEAGSDPTPDGLECTR